MNTINEAHNEVKERLVKALDDAKLESLANTASTDARSLTLNEMLLEARPKR